MIRNGAGFARMGGCFLEEDGLLGSMPYWVKI